MRYRIAYYLQGVSKRKFNNDPLLQDGVVRQIEIIGEAIKRVSKIPWQDIAE